MKILFLSGSFIVKITKEDIVMFLLTPTKIISMISILDF